MDFLSDYDDSKMSFNPILFIESFWSGWEKKAMTNNDHFGLLSYSSWILLFSAFQTYFWHDSEYKVARSTFWMKKFNIVSKFKVKVLFILLWNWW